MRKAILAVGILLGGCGGATGQVSLTPRASSATAALMSSAPTADGIALSRVRILVNEAELRGGPRGEHHGMCGHGGRSHAEDGPFVVALSAEDLASGRAAEPVTISDVPAGKYRGTELEIEPLHREHHEAAPQITAELQDFADGTTAIIEGSFKGAPFAFRGSFRAEQEGETPVTVEAGQSVSLALTVDATGWFKAADGSTLDPSVAENHDAIAATIKRSLTIDPDDGRDHHGH